jgi:hypothetical protein
VLAPRGVADAPPAVRPPKEPEALTAESGEREPGPLTSSGRADS